MVDEEFKSFLELVPDAMVIVDNQGRIVLVNNQTEKLFGYAREELIGNSLEMLMPMRFRGTHVQHREAYSLHPHTRPMGVALELYGVHKNGREFPVEISLSPFDRSGEHLVCSAIRDVSERKKAEEQILYLANHDTLTGLPNRRFFVNLLSQALTGSSSAGSQVALIFLDLDQFKPINDQFGHEVGDEVLKAIGSRLMKSLRNGDHAARLGGDEFAVILSRVAKTGDVRRVAEEMLHLLVEPIQVNDRAFQISASMGISLFPLHGKDIGSLFRCADRAMYIAKQMGKNRFAFYESRD